MGKVTVKFEADSRDELVKDIGEFLNLCLVVDTSPSAETAEPPKPKTRGRKSKKDKEAEEAAKTPATATIDLGAGPETPAELPTPTHPELVAALTALQVAKGDDVIIQIMEEFGGSTKMMEIPEENYALLFSEVIKATNG